MVAIPIVERLRAPAYWMSGSSDGHEGENDLPREAATLIEDLAEALEICLAMAQRQSLASPLNLRGQSPYDIGITALRKARGDQ